MESLLKEVLPHLVTLAAVIVGWLLADASNRRKERLEAIKSLASLRSELLLASISAEMNTRTAVMSGIVAVYTKHDPSGWQKLDTSTTRKHVEAGVPTPELRLMLGKLIEHAGFMNSAADRWPPSRLTVLKQVNVDEEYAIDRYAYYKSATAFMKYAKTVLRETLLNPGRENLPAQATNHRRIDEWVAYATWTAKFIEQYRRAPTAEELPNFWEGALPNLNEFQSTAEEDRPKLIVNHDAIRLLDQSRDGNHDQTTAAL